MVNFVEGFLKVHGEEAPICVAAVAKHPPCDGVGRRPYSLCPVRRPEVLGKITGHSGEQGLRHKATQRIAWLPLNSGELSYIFRARARMTGAHLLGDRLRAKGQWFVKKGRAGLGQLTFLGHYIGSGVF